MKMLLSAISMLVFITLAPTQDAMAVDWKQMASEELCVVEGSEELRSKMYQETPEAEEIMEAERAGCWMLAERDLESLAVEIIDENGLLFLDGGDILYGRDQQIAMFTEFLKAKDFFLTYEPVEAHVSESKDMAWAWGIYKFQMQGMEMEVGKYTSVWEKKDGKWLNVSEMRNPFER